MQKDSRLLLFTDSHRSRAVAGVDDDAVIENGKERVRSLMNFRGKAAVEHTANSTPLPSLLDSCSELSNDDVFTEK